MLYSWSRRGRLWKWAATRNFKRSADCMPHCVPFSFAKRSCPDTAGDDSMGVMRVATGEGDRLKADLRTGHYWRRRRGPPKGGTTNGSLLATGEGDRLKAELRTGHYW